MNNPMTEKEFLDELENLVLQIVDAYRQERDLSTWENEGGRG